MATSRPSAKEPWSPTIAGVQVTAPKWAKYAVKNPDGTWYWCEQKPEPYTDCPIEEWSWLVDSGKTKLIFKHDLYWQDSILRNPLLLGSTEEARKEKIIKNAAARYTAALGNIVYVGNSKLIGIVLDSSITWMFTKQSLFFEIIDTPEAEYLRIKGRYSAPYWRALPCSELKEVKKLDYVIIRSIRESLDGSETPSVETSFSRRSGIIDSPLIIHPSIIPLYVDRHPEITFTDSIKNSSEPLIISDIHWE